MHLIIRVRRLCRIPSICKRNSQSFWFHQPHWLSSLNIWSITATAIIVIIIKTKSSRADNSTTSSWLAKFLLEKRSVAVGVVVTWKWNESILRIIFWYEYISLLSWRRRRMRMRHWLSLVIGILLVITILRHTLGMIWRILGKLRQIHFDSLSTVWAYIGLIYWGRWRCCYFFVFGRWGW